MKFPEMWLAAPPKIKALFTPDDRQAIPRLDQLVEMIEANRIVLERSTNYNGKVFYSCQRWLGTIIWWGSSREEALLKAICHEHGLEWSNGEWK